MSWMMSLSRCWMNLDEVGHMKESLLQNIFTRFTAIPCHSCLPTVQITTHSCIFVALVSGNSRMFWLPEDAATHDITGLLAHDLAVWKPSRISLTVFSFLSLLYSTHHYSLIKHKHYSLICATVPRWGLLKHAFFNHDDPHSIWVNTFNEVWTKVLRISVSGMSWILIAPGGPDTLKTFGPGQH